MEEAEREGALAESDLAANGGGNGGDGDVINGCVGFSGTSDKPGRLEGSSHRLASWSSGIDRFYSHAVGNSGGGTTAADSVGGEGAHLVEPAAAAAADEIAQREEEEGISVGPAASAGSATARQPRNDADEGEVDPRPQFAAVRIAGTAGAAAATAGERVGNVSGRTGVVDSPEPPVNEGAAYSARGREGDKEGADTNQEAFMQDASSAVEERRQGAEAAGNGTEEPVYFEGVHPSAPVMSAIVGGPEAGSDVVGTDGSRCDAPESELTPSPPSTSWFDRVAATPAVGLLRRWLNCSDKTVGNPASLGPRILTFNDAEEQEPTSPATSVRGRRLDAGWNSYPTVAPFKGAFSERVEDWRVRDGHRRSRCAYGTAL